MQADSRKVVERPHHTSTEFQREARKQQVSRLSEAERRQLAAWNATQQDFPLDAYVPQLVARWATATPDALAIIDGKRVLTYRTLNRRANQLAHYLQSLAVGPNMLVCLCVERSSDLVIALLGILKAGAAYVALDVTYPPERLAFMLEDTQAPVLITQQPLFERLFPGSAKRGRTVVCLDRDAGLLEEQRGDEPSCALTPDDLAYVVYTSGSTGRPKGVQIVHKGLLNLVFWHQRAFAVSTSDRATQLSSPAFDATGWELWPYLTAGASIYLPDEETRTTPSLLRDWLIRNAITITFLPTALAESMLTLEWPRHVALRYLLTGADTLHRYPSPELPFALINNYGPSEATVLVTSGRVPPTREAMVAPTIGHIIANTQIYILDEQLNQVPIGEAGEIYIGGIGLARGYLNQPALTAERFIRHPFSSDPAARLYRTGDLARFLPDGQIAFLGRADHQIKIRGYRIEPDEIMVALNNLPSILASVVVAREDIWGDKRLIAYLVPTSGADLTVSVLREALLERLPDFMVPAIFVKMEALPMTSNGKVDRAALPAPDEQNMIRDGVIDLPTTPTEERIAAIVTPLLGLNQVGIDENFFMLGGHSLLGTQIITRVSESFDIKLPLRALFEAPTIRLLAAEVEQRVLAKIEAMSDEEVLRLLEQS